MVVVSAAEPRNADAIADLIDQMDRFYGATETEPRAKRLLQIQAALFSSSANAHGLLAWDDEQLVGLATYSFLWPAEGVTSSVFLKELYVAETHRRHGIGKSLMQQVCQVAVDNQCSRVEWMTDEGNADAQDFYDQLGVPKFTAKVFYRVEGEQIALLASRQTHRHP